MTKNLNKNVNNVYNPFPSESEVTAPVMNYDNEGAREALQSLLDRERYMNVTFYTDKSGAPALYIEQTGIDNGLLAGFKFFPKYMEEITQLWLYGFEQHIPVQMKVDTENCHPIQEGDFGLHILDLMLSCASSRVTIMPKFLMRNPDRFRASIKMNRISFFFNLDRSPELEKVLEKYHLQ